jgi:hypothetical protein
MADQQQVNNALIGMFLLVVAIASIVAIWLALAEMRLQRLERRSGIDAIGNEIKTEREDYLKKHVDDHTRRLTEVERAARTNGYWVNGLHDRVRKLEEKE